MSGGDVERFERDRDPFELDVHWPVAPRRVVGRVLPGSIEPARGTRVSLPGPGVRLTDDAPPALRRHAGAVIVVFYTLAGLVILSAVALAAGVVGVVAFRILRVVIS